MCSKSKSHPYVEDYRYVIMYQRRRLRYPKNYNKIVESGEIKIATTSEGNTVLKLLYGPVDKKGYRPCFTLLEKVEDVCHNKAYYVVFGLVENTEDVSKGYYEPFGFRKKDLEKYVPVIDIKKTDDPNHPYHIANTLYLAKKNCSVNPESGELDQMTDRKEKGLNGKILYTSTSKHMDTTFYVIRDENEKLEVDKSIICVPVTLLASIIKICFKLLIWLPMKLGGYLLSKQNAVAKLFGHIFFTPFVPLKFIVDIGATIIKFPVLLFTCDEKKYGDKYWCLWKHEFLECFHELKSNYSLIKSGKRPEIEEKPECNIIGTWDELNIRQKYIKYMSSCI